MGSIFSILPEKTISTEIMQMDSRKDKSEEAALCELNISSENGRKMKSQYSFKEESNVCLCNSILPIIWLSQHLGIIPLTLVHPKIGTCQLIFKWKSGATIFSSFFLLFYLIINPFSYFQIRDRMSAVFSGTDLYAFTFQTLAMVLETTIIIGAGRLSKEKFSKGWEALNGVFHAMCDSAGDTRKIKIGSWFAALLIFSEFISFFSMTYWTSYRSIGVYQSCMALIFGTLVITLSLIIPYILSTLFLFVCLLIRSHFLKISEMLRTIVRKDKLTNTKLHAKIDALRVLHEELCQAVAFFEDFFGVQVLLTLCTSCFTVTTGAYACILEGEGISSPLGQQLTGAWVMQLYCAAIFMFLILIAGQLVTNAAASPAPVLNMIPFTDLDSKSQTQVNAFLNKIAAFPTKMSAVKITAISTTFLASAATNITTYLLVLMQFKLSFESAAERNRSRDDREFEIISPIVETSTLSI